MQPVRRWLQFWHASTSTLSIKWGDHIIKNRNRLGHLGKGARLFLFLFLRVMGRLDGIVRVHGNLCDL